MVSKYYEPVFNLLEKEQIKSTFSLLQELKIQTKKAISWIQVYSILRDLQREGKAELIETKHSLFWRKK